MWAFHTMHHAQEQLNFATTARFHPVDHFISNTIRFVPMLMFGASPKSWLPAYFAIDLLTTTLHSRITWRFGALSRVFVTPGSIRFIIQLILAITLKISGVFSASGTTFLGQLWTPLNNLQSTV
jgi:hypothetical protein